MDLKDLLKYVTQRVALPDATIIIRFDAFVTVKPGEPHAKVIDFLRRTGGTNRNIFRLGIRHEVMWQVKDHYWRGDSSSDPFNHVKLVNGHLIGTTDYGFEYLINRDDGSVNLIKWSKM